jgi:hypothetical protein
MRQGSTKLTLIVAPLRFDRNPSCKKALKFYKVFLSAANFAPKGVP